MGLSPTLNPRWCHFDDFAAAEGGFYDLPLLERYKLPRKHGSLGHPAPMMATPNGYEVGFETVEGEVEPCEPVKAANGTMSFPQVKDETRREIFTPRLLLRESLPRDSRRFD